MGAIHTFGNVPLLFYCAHLWLYRLRLGWMPRPPFFMNLEAVSAFWVVRLLILLCLCIRSVKLKRSRSDSLLQYI